MSTNGNLTEENLIYFKNRLMKMKQETQDKRSRWDADGPNNSIHELADFSNHPADLGTEQFEQQRDAGFALMQKDQLEHINDALKRIENGTFGLSEKSGKPIPFERLEAQPTARNLVEEE